MLLAEAHGGPGLRERSARAAHLVYKRLLSPVIHAGGLAHCTHLPTCSEYALVAVLRHGWLRGGALALRRLARCNPFTPGGFDPVP